MPTLPAKSGKLLARAGRILSLCKCCCPCKSPWCCNAPDEVFASLSLSGGKRTVQWDLGSGNTAQTVTLEFEIGSPSGTYTLNNSSGFLPCGTSYRNIADPLFSAGVAGWPSVPVIWLGRIQYSSVEFKVESNVYVYAASGKASYRRTGYLPEEDLNKPVRIGFGASVPPQASEGGKYPCERWDAIGALQYPTYGGGAVSAIGSDKFNYWSGFVGREDIQGRVPTWNPPLDLRVSFSV